MAVKTTSHNAMPRSLPRIRCRPLPLSSDQARKAKTSRHTLETEQEALRGVRGVVVVDLVGARYRAAALRVGGTCDLAEYLERAGRTGDDPDLRLVVGALVDHALVGDDRVGVDRHARRRARATRVGLGTGADQVQGGDPA